MKSTSSLKQSSVNSNAFPEPSQSPPRPKSSPYPSQELPESFLGWAAREGSGLFLGGPMKGQMLSSIINKSNLERFGTRLG